MISTIVFINNDISAELARRDLAERNIRLAEVAVILGRELDQPWLGECGMLLRYGAAASLNMSGQARFIGFYRAAAKIIRKVRRAGGLRNIYIVNNDNLISSHLLKLARDDARMNVTVVAEGLMNYQNITTENRAAWRWRVKPVMAAALGMHYRKPAGHLSGAFEACVDRVVSFAAPGLKAPPDKVIEYPLKPVEPRVATDPRVGLLVHTALWQWMPEAEYERFADGFADWITSLGFTKLYTKPHPRYPTGMIETLLPPHQVIDVPRPVEELASDLEAGTVIGTCCTALATLKLIRPDLDCVDFGADFYLDHAYQGDRSVMALFDAVGVRSVPFRPSASDSGTK